MDLGAFSVSLAVKDLDASRAFYETLGFQPFHGDAASGWLILRNGEAVIGLFQGMFEGNILTFNPGWNGQAQDVDPFTDVREVQRALLAAGIEVTQAVDESTAGPGFISLKDPDGNAILIDQHR